MYFWWCFGLKEQISLQGKRIISSKTGCFMWWKCWPMIKKRRQGSLVCPKDYFLEKSTPKCLEIASLDQPAVPKPKYIQFTQQQILTFKSSWPVHVWSYSCQFPDGHSSARHIHNSLAVAHLRLINVYVPRFSNHKNPAGSLPFILSSLSPCRWLLQGFTFSSCSGIMGRTTCSLRMGSVHIMSSCVTCHIPHIPNTQKRGPACAFQEKKNLGKWVTLYVGVSEVVTHPNLSGFHNKFFF